MIKNFLKSLMALAMFGSLLAGCSSKNDSASADSEKMFYDIDNSRDSSETTSEEQSGEESYETQLEKDAASKLAQSNESSESNTESNQDQQTSSSKQASEEDLVRVVDAVSLPESLRTFLEYLNFYQGDRYDAQNPAQSGVNLFENICIYPNCFNFSLYPSLAAPEFHFGEMDPRGWSTDIQGYAIYDGPSVDWIATNLFNLSPEELESEIAQAEQNQTIYRQDQPDGSYDYYVTNVFGAGGAFPAARVLSAEQQGSRYTITFDMVNRTPSMDERASGPHYVEVEEKSIDGNTYWSLLRFQKNSESWNG